MVISDSIFKLHLISYPVFFDGEAKVLINILQRYDVYLHLRKPGASDTDYSNLINQIPSVYYSRIFLHSAYALQQNNAFAGLHFSTSKRNIANGIKENVVNSTSCHALEEVKSLESDFNQCFLSPIFPSISKNGYSGDLDLKEISKFLKSDRKLKVIALGGIEASNILDVKNWGFDGGAVLGTIWGDNPHADDDFLGKVAQLLKLIK